MFMTTPSRHAITDPRITLLKLVQRQDAQGIAGLLLAQRRELLTWGDWLVQEQLAPYLYSALKDHHLTALLPRTALMAVQDQAERQRERTARLLDILYELDGTLAAVEIPYLVLKGLPLAVRFWGGADRRFSWDLDLLVPARDLSRAFYTLTARGCQPLRYTFGVTWLTRRAAHAINLNFKGIPVDLHWRLRHRPGICFAADREPRGGGQSPLWERCMHLTFGGREVRVLGDVDLLGLLLFSIVNDLERGHCRLRILWDIYLALQQLPDFDWYTLLCARDDGLGPLLANALAVVLYRLDSTEEFPSVATLLADERAALRILDQEATLKLLGHPPQSLANRQWFARLQPLPVWRYWLWWGTTVPLRYWLGRGI